MAFRPFAVVALIVLIVGAGVWLFSPGPRPTRPAPSKETTAGPPPAMLAPPPAVIQPQIEAPPPPPRLDEDCRGPDAFAAAASTNAAALSTLPVTLFGRPEQGWDIYAPLAGQSVGSACGPTTPAFAAALGRWQAAHRLPADGIMTLATLEALRVSWHARRPFVAATRSGQCPAPPPDTALADATRLEGYSGKPAKLRATALDAWRRMVAAARAERPEIAADPRLLTIFSGFRGPDEELARCLDGGCGGPTRANCSAHRTGLAADLFVGAAPGSRPESTDDANRLFQSRSAAYRWLAANAGRFGWVGYPFEPWHWEWTGEPP